MLSEIRNGNFTSSEIVKLCSNGKSKGSFGAPFYTYIDECNMERRLGRPLENEIDSKPTSWGKLCEQVAFNTKTIGLEYKLCSDVTIKHPKIDFWCGSPDSLKGDDTVGDFKCPMTLKSFCQLVDPYYENGNLIHDGLTIEAVRANHKDGDKYFWQLVSNAIITGRKKAELIIFCPFLDELDGIRELASSAGEMGEYTKWVYFAPNEQLPHLIRGNHYNNINIISFDVFQKDIDFLESRVLAGGELLTPWPKQKTI